MYMVEGMLVYLTAQRCTMFKLRAEHRNIKRHVCEHAHCWGHGGGLEEHMCVYMFALSGGYCRSVLLLWGWRPESQRLHIGQHRPPSCPSLMLSSFTPQASVSPVLSGYLEWGIELSGLGGPFTFSLFLHKQEA